MYKFKFLLRVARTILILEIIKPFYIRNVSF